LTHEWKDPETWPVIWSLFASEVSYQENQRRLAAISPAQAVSPEGVCPHCGQAVSKEAEVFAKPEVVLSSNLELNLAKEARVAELSAYQDRDLQIVDHWIAGLHKEGIDFFKDPLVMAQRPIVMQDLIDQEEARRTQIYEQALQATDQATLDRLMEQDQEFANHQALIKDLLAGECLWLR